MPLGVFFLEPMTGPPQDRVSRGSAGDVLEAQSCWNEPWGFPKGLVMAERFRICSYERGDSD